MDQNSIKTILMARVNILCTKRIKPLLAGKAAVQGIRIKVVEFIRIHLLISEETAEAFKKTGPEAVYVFTSANSVDALYKLVNTYQLNINKQAIIYATEGRTAAMVKQLFPQFQIAGTAPTASELAGKIIGNKEKKLTFFCGNIRRQELPAKLKEKGIGLNEIQVYRTELTPVKVDEKFDGVLFFSPSAVSSFFEKNKLSAGVTCFAVGETTAEALREYTNNKIIVARQPLQEQVIDLIIDHYKRK